MCISMIRSRGESQRHHDGKDIAWRWDGVGVLGFVGGVWQE